MSNPQQPWQRVRTPAALPATTTAETLRRLPADDLAILLRDHLIPIDQEPRYRARWKRFWDVLAFAPDLNERAQTILKKFLDVTSHALEHDELDEAQVKRANTFFDRVDAALARIEDKQDSPLAWAGSRAAEFNEPARIVIDALVKAIAGHREDGDDQKLWDVLEQQRLDPTTSRRRPRRSAD